MKGKQEEGKKRGENVERGEGREILFRVRFPIDFERVYQCKRQIG